MRARPGTAFKQLWLAIVRLHESAQWPGIGAAAGGGLNKM